MTNILNTLAFITYMFSSFFYIVMSHYYYKKIKDQQCVIKAMEILVDKQFDMYKNLAEKLIKSTINTEKEEFKCNS